MINVFEKLKKIVSKNSLSYAGVVRGPYIMILLYIPENLVNEFDASRLFFQSGDEFSVFEFMGESSPAVNEKGLPSFGGKFINARILISDILVSDDVRFIYDNNQIECADDRYSLSFLIYHSYDDFQKKFSFAANRVVDEETVRYIARNNMLGSKALSGTVRVTSFSIYLYKSLSCGIVDADEIEKFFNMARKSVEIFSKEELRSNSIRTDVLSRAASITLAYLHYLIAYADPFKIKGCIMDFLSFCEKLEQPQRKKMRLEDQSYLYSKLIGIGLLSSWKNEDFNFFCFLQNKLVEVYSYAAKKSAGLPYVYLKEFGETYDLYLKFKFFLQIEHPSFEDFFDFAKGAFRVKSKLFLDRVFDNVSRFNEKNTALIISKSSVGCLSSSPFWYEFNPIKNGRYSFEAGFLSDFESAKGCIFCIKNSMTSDIEESNFRIKGVLLSSIRGLGFFKYIVLHKGYNSISFEFEFDGFFFDQCAVFMWDKNIKNVKCLFFGIREIES